MTEKLHKTDEEWRRMLTPEQYRVARTRGTEPAFTGAYWNTKTDGTYMCVCCGQPLFSSKAKYDSARAAVATHTSGTFSTTARSRRANATASTPPP
jgi:peptide methionine sulfoxide reductase MsrB